MEVIKEQILRVKCPSSQKKVQDFMNCLEKDLGNKAQPQIWDMANFNIQKPMEEFLHTDYQQLTSEY